LPALSDYPSRANAGASSTHQTYNTLWGCWKGPEEVLLAQGGRYQYAVKAWRAFTSKMISEQIIHELMRLKTDRLARCGFEDLNPKPDHLLVSLQPREESETGASGGAEARLCNFELIRPIAGSAQGGGVGGFFTCTLTR
jgi:hypothetical protein